MKLVSLGYLNNYDLLIHKTANSTLICLFSLTVSDLRHINTGYVPMLYPVPFLRLNNTLDALRVHYHPLLIAASSCLQHLLIEAG